MTMTVFPLRSLFFRTITYSSFSAHQSGWAKLCCSNKQLEDLRGSWEPRFISRVNEKNNILLRKKLFKTLINTQKGRFLFKSSVVMGVGTTSMGSCRDWIELQIQHGQVEIYR